MVEEGNRSTLKDIVNYDVEEHITESEKELIQRTFRGNPTLINLLRKIFIPMVSDESLPIEDFAKDSFLVGKQWDQIPAAEAKILMVAREDAIKFILGGLIKIKIMAADIEISPEEKAENKKKDSSQ